MVQKQPNEGYQKSPHVPIPIVGHYNCAINKMDCFLLIGHICIEGQGSSNEFKKTYKPFDFIIF